MTEIDSGVPIIRDANPHLRRSIRRVHGDIERMAMMVEAALTGALTAFETKDYELAEKIVQNDSQIDALYVDIEDLCAKIIATDHPVATDLRHMLTSIKICSNLERVGDYARIFAGAIETATDEAFDSVAPLISKMLKHGLRMVRDLINAYVENDAEEAKTIAKRDDALDAMHRDLYKRLIKIMQENPEKIDEASSSVMVLNRIMERLGDHVASMCEWVVFAVEGKHSNLNP